MFSKEEKNIPLTFIKIYFNIRIDGLNFFVPALNVWMPKGITGILNVINCSKFTWYTMSHLSVFFIHIEFVTPSQVNNVIISN
jgi:hypothetical protein